VANRSAANSTRARAKFEGGRSGTERRPLGRSAGARNRHLRLSNDERNRFFIRGERNWSRNATTNAKTIIRSDCLYNLKLHPYTKELYFYLSSVKRSIRANSWQQGAPLALASGQQFDVQGGSMAEAQRDQPRSARNSTNGRVLEPRPHRVGLQISFAFRSEVSALVGN
jgi:hypothetical protein